MRYFQYSTLLLTRTRRMKVENSVKVSSYIVLFIPVIDRHAAADNRIRLMYLGTCGAPALLD